MTGTASPIWKQQRTNLGAMKASALWMTAPEMAGAASVPPHSQSTCTPHSIYCLPGHKRNDNYEDSKGSH